MTNIHFLKPNLSTDFAEIIFDELYDFEVDHIEIFESQNLESSIAIAFSNDKNADKALSKLMKREILSQFQHFMDMENLKRLYHIDETKLVCLPQSIMFSPLFFGFRIFFDLFIKVHKKSVSHGKSV